jgi:hypothetical protein
LQEHKQQLKWLLLQPYPFALLRQLASLSIGDKDPKAQARRCWLFIVHGDTMLRAAPSPFGQGRLSHQSLFLSGLPKDLHSAEKGETVH